MAKGNKGNVAQDVGATPRDGNYCNGKVKPKKIILVHGDRTEEFSGELKKKGFDVEAPKAGDVIKA